MIRADHRTLKSIKKVSRSKKAYKQNPHSNYFFTGETYMEKSMKI